MAAKSKPYNEIRSSGGDGDQILATLGNEIAKFHNDTVAIAHVGLQEVFDGNRPSDLGSLLYAFLKDLRLSRHKDYFACLPTRNLQGDIEIRTTGLQRRSKIP